jgi:hypothetical protein
MSANNTPIGSACTGSVRGVTDSSGAAETEKRQTAWPQSASSSGLCAPLQVTILHSFVPCHGARGW